MGIEVFAAATGLLQGWLALRNLRSNWIVYVVQLTALIVFSWNNRLYGDVAQNTFMLLICIWGFFKWKTTYVESMRTAPCVYWLIAALLLTVGFGAVLSRTNDPLPFADAFSTITTFLALWLMARRKTEAWLVWGVNDLAYIYEYLMLPTRAWWLLCLYVVWFIMAAWTWISWKYEETVLIATKNRYAACLS